MLDVVLVIVAESVALGFWLRERDRRLAREDWKPYFDRLRVEIYGGR